MSQLINFIQKYPKYCARCHKYYPGAWKECTTCKIRLVGAGQGWIRDWLKKINYWLIVAVVIGVAFWGINKTMKDGTWTRVIELKRK